MTPIRIGIVGTGNIARSHAQHFGAITDVKLAACQDIVAERAKSFAAAHGVVHAVDSLDDLLNESDLVVVSTPDAAHAEITLKALAAGKHVLCEKPLTATMQEAKLVVEAARLARARGQHHAINLSKRNAPAIQRAIELVQSGQLGEIRHVHGSYLQAWLASRYLGPWSDAWLLWRLATDMGSGGALSDLGVHLLDYATAVAGEVRAVRCTLRSYAKPAECGTMVTHHDGHALDANDTALIDLELTGGGLATLHTSRWGTGIGNSERLDVHGTHGALSLDLAMGADRLRTCLGNDRHRNAWTTSEGMPPVPSVQQRLITAIRGGAPADPDLIRGANVQAMLDACVRSSASGAWEKPERV
jgi:predicted dehydrogenase